MEAGYPASHLTFALCIKSTAKSILPFLCSREVGKVGEVGEEQTDLMGLERAYKEQILK
jgi:hypothetical protein